MPENSPHEDYPFADAEATRMLADGLARALVERGLTQRDVSRELGYKSSVVVSHMALGRVPVPIDRAADIARLLTLDASRFLYAVLRQRHPNVDFASLFDAHPPMGSSGDVAAELETIAGRSLDDLDSGTIAVLREVVAAADPNRRWLSLEEVSILDAIRAALPKKGGVAPTKERLARLTKCLVDFKEGRHQ